MGQRGHDDGSRDAVAAEEDVDVREQRVVGGEDVKLEGGWIGFGVAGGEWDGAGGAVFVDLLIGDVGERGWFVGEGDVDAEPSS